MTLWFYVKTEDDPKTVGTIVCNANFAQGKHPEDKYSWVLEAGKDEPGYWEIKGEYDSKDMSSIGIVYKVGDTVVFAEIDDDALVTDFADPLIEKYGFDNVKWIVVPSKK